MTFEDICEKLKSSGIEDHRIEAAILIEEIMGNFSEGEDYTDVRLLVAVEKRCERYPLQYIIGKWWFCRCELEVTDDCLSPRPDTETVVEEAIKLLPEGGSFADLCTGSGCIAIALCEMREDLFGSAVELYPRTLELAKKNALRNHVGDRLEFILDDVLKGEALGEKKYFAIISNPPYIKSDVIDTLAPEVLYEPRAALDGGEDGLIFYRTIVEKYQKNLCDGGCFIFEIGYDQADEIKDIADKNGFSCAVKRDLGGCCRVAILKRR